MATRQIEYTVRGNNAAAAAISYLGKEVSVGRGVADDPIVRVIEESFRETYPDGTECTVTGTVEISAVL